MAGAEGLPGNVNLPHAIDQRTSYPQHRFSASLQLSRVTGVLASLENHCLTGSILHKPTSVSAQTTR